MLVGENRYFMGTKRACEAVREANYLKMEAATGFEPVNNGFADRCLTTWLCRPGRMLCSNKNGAGNGIRTRDFNLGKVALYH